MSVRVPRYREGALTPEPLRDQLVAYFAVRFCSGRFIDHDAESTALVPASAVPAASSHAGVVVGAEEDLDETTFRREVEVMPAPLRLAVFRFICKHMRRSDGRLNEQVFGRRLLGDRVWPLVEDLPLTSVNLAAMDRLFGSLETTGTRGDMTGILLEGLLEWGPADSITHLEVLTSAPAEKLDHTTATFGCLNCRNFPSITSLNLSGRLCEAEEEFTEMVFEALVQWEGLASLVLANCTFPESLTGLRSLVLGQYDERNASSTHTRVHLSILDSVAGLTQLEELRLSKCDELTSDLLARILQFEGLNKLSLSSSPCWPPGSVDKPNTNLKWLRITPTPAQARAVIEDVARLFPSLHTLDIRLTSLPEDFASLSVALPSVYKLVVRTDDEGVMSHFLHTLPNIEQSTPERIQTLEEGGHECLVKFSLPEGVALQITKVAHTASPQQTPDVAGLDFLSQVKWL